MASIHLDMEDLDWTVREFEWFREQGYRIVKGGWGKRPEAVFGLDRSRDIELTRRVREVIGEDLDLVLDVLGAQVKWDVSTAIERCRDLEPYRLKWDRGTAPASQFRGARALAREHQYEIGTGEQEWNVEGYRG